ncbi:MAG: UDP-N-acetylmuramate--L-alanine ligase [Candidatus Terrybacteria bacterium RIFCSPLOWO2_01_FULL_40_23]|uniref:UDP-N-acetylmuramate--L-alanine ligase n=1 Tax=Candidatus Terrybacteria bacterium RIFCSPLOWO2_01_FULL_40_23 TaxID=1802366 RepID=A0A1G2PVX6_9BACT|nr:MAG: UDP-N-acetylmuramate--L-alanine ligase [Candidatus Terrybacteria bacterium RIFCSPLOWO2_01_FULL_40_23]
MEINIHKAKKIHLVGIKGVGMTALAQMLKALDKNISGSDKEEVFFTDNILKRFKIKVFKGFYVKNIDTDTDLIISSAAYIRKKGNTFLGSGPGTKIINYAISKNIPVLSYPEAISQLFNKSFGIAVAGTHGKSTTSAMAAVMLEHCRKDPRAIIGTKVLNWQANARVSQASLQRTPFVLEADEYRDAFLNYYPHVILLTNIEWDHPDYFSNNAIYKKSFLKFLKNLDKRGSLIYCADDPGATEIAEKNQNVPMLSYGFSLESRLRIISEKGSSKGTNFSLVLNNENIGYFNIKLFGKHNVLNATAVVALGIILGLPVKNVRKGLAAFKGTARRLEVISYRPNIIVDDYAHHPTEISATISAVKKAWPDKNIAVLFQPHTFSRTRALFGGFVSALKNADRSFILETYGSARERAVKNKTAKKLAKKLNSLYFNNISTAQKKLPKVLGDKDVLITMGAGDVWRVGEILKKQKFQKR